MIDRTKPKIRCSGLGNIMTQPKTKKAKENGELSQTAIQYLIEVEIKQRTGREKEIITKHMEKGIEMEEDSITMLSQVRKSFFRKNEELFENEYIKGTPDIITEDRVRDIKTSWDIFSFPHPWKYEMSKLHYWQLMGYMWLTDRERASLDFVLIDTPDHIIEREIGYQIRQAGVDIRGEATPWDYEEFAETVKRKLTYGDLPIEKRVYSVEIERCDEDIEQIKEQVEKAWNFWEQNIGVVR